MGTKRSSRQSQLFLIPSVLLVYYTSFVKNIAVKSMATLSVPMDSGNAISLHYIHNEAASSSSDLKIIEKNEDITPIILIHGLDSSSHTWRRTLNSLKAFPVYALDCRGCGRSDLGDFEKFSPDALVEDVRYFTDQRLKGKKPFVLVGHSMGGRVAMSFAAKYPERVAALVVEDMDIDRRMNNPFPSSDAVTLFDRDLKTRSTEDVLDIFAKVGYPANMVQRWINEGRIYLNDSGTSFWSDVNPAFRHLCYEHFCFTDVTLKAWETISSSSLSFPCHVMVADDDLTICDPKSIDKMQSIMGNDRLTVHTYPGASHSIHNSAHKDFISDLTNILQKIK